MSNVIEKNRRLAILQFLADGPDYSMNASVLQSALRAIGHSVSKDRLETDCHWLNEQGLVEIQSEDLPVSLLKITQRGLEVAAGIVIHPGVDRPLPRR